MGQCQRRAVGAAHEEALGRIVETSELGLDPVGAGRELLLGVGDRRLEVLVLRVEPRQAGARLDVDLAGGQWDVGLWSGTCRSGLVLTTERGFPLRNSNWAEGWRKAVLDAGIGHARPYDLRHTFASWLLQQGIGICQVK